MASTGSPRGSGRWRPTPSPRSGPGWTTSSSRSAASWPAPSTTGRCASRTRSSRPRSTSSQTQRIAQADTDQRLKQLSALAPPALRGQLETVPAEVTNYGTSDFAATIDISVGRERRRAAQHAGGGDGRPGGPGGAGQPQHVHRPPDHRRPVGRWGCASVPGPTRWPCISGHGPGKPLSAGLVPSNTPLTDGEIFITSGLPDAEFPGDIPVATVVSPSNGATASAGDGHPGAAGRPEPSPLRVGAAVRAVA